MVDACADLNWDSEREKQKQKELESTAVKQPMYTTEKPSSAAASPAQGSQQPDHSVVIDLDSEAITQAALKFADTAARNGFVRKVSAVHSRSWMLPCIDIHSRSSVLAKSRGGSSTAPADACALL